MFMTSLSLRTAFLGLLVATLACQAPAAPAPTAGGSAGAIPAATDSAPAAAPPPRERVKLGYSQRSVSQGMHIYALEGGYFDRYGLDVETTQIPGTTLLAAAMIAGEVQFA